MRQPPPDGVLDANLQRHHGLIGGVDEVGRGALAGPLTVAAVVLDPGRWIGGLDDSKRLSAKKRSALAGLIREWAVAFTVIHVSAAEVDRLNVLEATRAAMRRAVLRLAPAPGLVVCDAVKLDDVGMPMRSEIHADARYLCVAAASILAKVERDGLMVALAGTHPGYGWERNKGYGTRTHLEALRTLGPTPQHRRSFAPIRVLA